MRVVVAITLTLFLFVGTHYYTKFADSVRRKPKQVATVFDDGSWTLQIEATFDCVPDPDYDRPESLMVQLKGSDIFRSTNKISAGEKITVESIAGVEVGDNDFYLDANLALLEDFEFADSSRPGAIRAKLMRGKQTVADQVYWVPPGETSFSETIVFEVETGGQNENDHSDHDH